MEVKDRNLRILVTCLVFIAVGALFTVGVKSGYQQQRRAEEQRDYWTRIARDLNAEKEALEKEREGLQNDPVFIEREARRLLGYIRENEKPVDAPRGPRQVPPQPEPPSYPDARQLGPKLRNLVGMGQMGVAVALVILVALGVGLGFGGRWKTSVPETPKDELPAVPPGGMTKV